MCRRPVVRQSRVGTSVVNDHSSVNDVRKEPFWKFARHVKNARKLRNGPVAPFDHALELRDIRDTVGMNNTVFFKQKLIRNRVFFSIVSV
jgi:hypothetical protein